MNYNYLEITGFTNGKKLGRLLPYTSEVYNNTMSEPRKLKRDVPILAVDGVLIELRLAGKGSVPNSYSTVDLPEADLFFHVTNGNDEEVVSAVRLSSKQINELSELLESNLRTFRESR